MVEQNSLYIINNGSPIAIDCDRRANLISGVRFIVRQGRTGQRYEKKTVTTCKVLPWEVLYGRKLCCK